MPTKKPAKPKQPPLTVTIRQVENIGPCSSGDYFDCLNLIKSSPVPSGAYAQTDAASHRKFPKKPRYGPDTPIPLIDLAKILPSHAIAFLVQHFLSAKLSESIDKRHNDIADDAYLVAAREVLSSQTPKKKAKLNVKSKSTAR